MNAISTGTCILVLCKVIQWLKDPKEVKSKCSMHKSREATDKLLVKRQNETGDDFSWPERSCQTVRKTFSTCISCFLQTFFFLPVYLMGLESGLWKDFFVKTLYAHKCTSWQCNIKCTELWQYAWVKDSHSLTLTYFVMSSIIVFLLFIFNGDKQKSVLGHFCEKA